ncbi:hypothetical protein SK1NUM_26260 [Arachnia rubra]|jgi:hypothetical protein|nr:hypothetical protein SK1NUM_26260 [Arachnia rubra]
MDPYDQVALCGDTDGPQPVTLNQVEDGVVPGANPLASQLHILTVSENPILDTPPDTIPGLEHDDTEPSVPQIASSHEAR